MELIKKAIRDIPDFPKKGILFRDITPLLKDPSALRHCIRHIADQYRGRGVDAVVGAESRGFIFAVPIALELNVGFIPIRKPGKLPHETVTETYELEYGTDTLQIHRDAIRPGQKILMVDDLLATGGTMAACCRLVQQLGGQVAGCAFVIELAFLNGRQKLDGHSITSLVRYE